jgi:hypothetical protein|tara:strand:+ start:43 stop:870 length:828 start_codon:yes stop_codon:yes gene_type:complete
MVGVNTISINEGHLETLYDELSYAISHTSKGEMKEWGKGSAKLFIHLTIRRGRGLLKGMGTLLKFSTYETISFVDAVIKKNTMDHLSNRTDSAYKSIKDKSHKLYQTLKIIALSIRSNPKEAAPQILLGFIGFLIGSGGLDGDGGIPDKDLAFGIGNHRSIWTHSILPALAIETIAFSLVTLVNTVHSKLPEKHDRFWDKLVENNKKLATAFVGGTCAGIAYHLLVDMNPTADRIKPYSDLPISTTMMGHKAIFGANAAIEIIDLKEKGKYEHAT